jgi:hypothetical protein
MGIFAPALTPALEGRACLLFRIYVLTKIACSLAPLVVSNTLLS